jgi:glucose/arabinose dehydrogenase
MLVRTILATAILSTAIHGAAPFHKISKIELRPIFKKRFRQPVYVTPYPVAVNGCPDAYAIVEKPGTIRLESPQQRCKLTLVDLRDRVSDASLEEGLLGLAFPHDFAQSLSYYVYYSAAHPRRTILARITMRSATEFSRPKITELISIRQPFSNHNGGMLDFGPDGYLYLGVGDGGSGGDPRGYAQNSASHLGKILRIDVTRKSTSSEKSGTRKYRIPPTNPFANSADDRYTPRPEIFALGLRNPWRFSFSPEGRLIVADVGQNNYEELSFVAAGQNMGWNIMEGNHCFKPVQNCTKGAPSLTMPFYEYDHGLGQSILGGYVYTGNKVTNIRNRYVFADSISGRIFSLDYTNSNAKAELLIQAPGLYSSFGRLRDNELVIAELQSGKIYLLAPTGQVGPQ